MIREVLDPQWSLVPAARAVVAHVGGDLESLRAARIHLMAATLDRATFSHSRALATINVAIVEIEDGPPARERSAPAG